MVETHFPGIEGKRLRYDDHTWELTGRVDVRGTGDRLAVDAKRVDGVRHERATLRFGLRDPPGSLNPGNLGDPTARLERGDGQHRLLVATEGRTYRYELNSIRYE